MSSSKRITAAEASALYPNEWIVFREPRIDPDSTELLDGIVHYHDKDRDVALDKCAEVQGDTAVEFTGSPRYRTVTLSLDAEDKSTPKAA